MIGSLITRIVGYGFLVGAGSLVADLDAFEKARKADPSAKFDPYLAAARFFRGFFAGISAGIVAEGLSSAPLR